MINWAEGAALGVAPAMVPLHPSVGLN